MTSEWQPFKTAPKDGKPFFAWAPGYEWPEVIKWEAYEPDVAEEVGEHGYFRYAEDLVADVAEVDFDLLTHWRPLPPPPAS